MVDDLERRIDTIAERHGGRCSELTSTMPITADRRPFVGMLTNSKRQDDDEPKKHE